MSLPTPFYEDATVRIYCGDCRAIVPWLEPVDIVLTDPPYDGPTHAGARTAKRGSGDSPVSALDIGFAPLDVIATMPELVRLPQRWFVAFCAQEMLGDYQRIAGEWWVRGGFWRRPDGAPQFTGDRPGQPGEGLAITHRPGRKR